ncbi:hypothetical protein LCGC14_3159680 [marine sediment metagenome]|uniref:Helix-turn-helix type 11 domain-containing protein n=1 Tax=marine sediment metagenome TaxID=412755 RepID=A0A0F8VRL6_9ZZZZ
MSIDKLKRVLWRLQEMKSEQPGIYSNGQIRKAIMEEIGTDQRTVDNNIKHLRELGLLKPAGMGKMKADITYASGV